MSSSDFLSGKVSDPHARKLHARLAPERLHYDGFFTSFPAQVRADLFAKAIHKSYKAGEFIYSRGDEGTFMGIVMSGRLRMSMNAHDGHGVLVGLVEQGEVFGETTLLDGLPRTTDAEAETDSSLMIFRREDFMAALKNNPDAMHGIIIMLCHRLRLYLDTIDLIALQNLPRRLARHLLRLANDYGVEESGRVVVRCGLNQSSLGQQLATSRESINKQLKHFAAKGYISLHGTEIILLDIEALKKISGHEFGT